MVTKAHRGMMHVPRRGKGGGRTRPPRPPVRRMVTKGDPITGRMTGGVRRIEPRKPPRTHGDPRPVRRAIREVGVPKELKDYGQRATVNRSTTKEQLEQAMKALFKKQETQAQQNKNFLKNNPNFRMPEGIRSAFARGFLNKNKGGLMKSTHNDMRKGGLFK